MIKRQQQELYLKSLTSKQRKNFLQALKEAQEANKLN